MNFYTPDDSEFKRRYQEEVEMVLSGIDCVIQRDRALYCSSELTSGFSVYQALRERGLKTAAELKTQMGEAWYTAIWNPNVKSSVDFAEAVRAGLSDKTVVITPGTFSALDWTQVQYLAFWETLLRTRIKSVWFNRNWQFSNGCTFEYAVALDAGLPTFDQGGNVLDREAGIQQMRIAIQGLEWEGFDTSKLRENLERLQTVGTRR
jgi:hypothetical protein